MEKSYAAKLPSATSSAAPLGVNASIDLRAVLTSVTPSASPQTVGTTLTYVVTLDKGPNDNSNITAPTASLTLLVNGVAPALASLTLPTGATYNTATGEVRLAVGNITGSGTRTMTVSFTVPTSTADGAVVTAKAKGIISSSDTDATPTNNDGSAANANASTTMVAPADVTTDLTGPASLTAGQTSGTFTVSFTNNGPYTASAVTRTVTLPTGSTGITATGGTVAGNTITYPTLTTLASGGTASFTFTFTPPANVTPVTVTSNIGTSTSQGSNTGPNSDALSLAVAQVADVTTTLAGPASLTAGQTSGTFTVSFTNNGPSTASAVTRTVTLPTGSTGITATGGTVAGNTITYPTLTTLASAGTASFTFTFTPPADVTPVTVASNVGTSTGQGSNTAPDAASLSLAVTQVADVATSINASANPAFAGSSLTLTYTFANTGPSTANGYTRTITLPAGLAATGTVTVTGGTYNNASGAVTFTTPPSTLAGGSNANVTVTIANVPASIASIATSSATSTTTNEAGATANNSAALTVTVTPVADVVSSLPTVGPACSGQPLSFTVSYTNNGPSTAAGFGRTLTLPAGLTNAGGTVTFTGTGSATYTNASGLVTISGTPATLASGASANLTVTISNVPASFVGTGIAVGSSASTTTSQNGATSNDTDNATISVTATPAQPSAITAGGTACVGTTVTYSVTNVVGVTYTWSVTGTGWSIPTPSTTNSVGIVVGSGAGVITVTPSVGTCSGTARTLNVTPIAVPGQPGAFTAAPATVCSGSTQTYTAGAASGATSYQWTLPSGWTGTSTTTSINVTVGTSGGTVSVVGVNASGCVSATPRAVSVTVNPTPAQPSTISGSTGPCVGSTQTYSVTNVTGVTYNWSVSGTGWSIPTASTTNSVDMVVGSGAATITVTASQGGCTSTSRTLGVTPIAVPGQPGAFTAAPATVCSGSTQTYTAGTASGATSYQWTLPSGWTGTSTTTSINVTVGTSGGTVSVVGVNASGCVSATPRAVSVTVNPTPAQPSTISGSTGPCVGSTQTYSVTNVTGVTYNWSVSGTGWSIPTASTTNSVDMLVGSGTATITVTASQSGCTSTSRTLSVTPITCANVTISGVVYEDINYGGGAGRSYATANTSAVSSGFTSGTILRPNARIEVYNVLGAYLGTTTTNSAGAYSYSVPVGSVYTVRVVSSSVTSARPGSVAGLLPVLTYVNGDASRVGGQSPQLADAGNNTGANISTFTAQNIATVTVALAAVNNVDFGFNFDVVCNTNTTGQGSLAQFITNSNALTNANLAQVGQTAGRETSIFMISDGAIHAGLRLGLTNQLTGSSGASRAVITLTAALPTVTDAGTTINGTTQTTNVGNTNTISLGTNDEVGTDNLVVSALDGPEVEIVGNTGFANTLSSSANNFTLRGVAIRGGSDRSISITGGNNFLIDGNVIGTSAISYAWANNNTVSLNFGMYVQGGTAYGVIQNNLVGYTGTSGINISANNTTNTTTVQGNQFNQNGYNNAGGDGLTLGDGGTSGPVLVQGNLFTRSNSSAVQLEIGQTSLTQIINNAMVSCGKGGAGTVQSQLEGSAICYLQRNGSRRGSTADIISKNEIVDTQASGIVVGYGQQNVTITQNSIYNSGSVAIDLVPNPNAYVNGPGSGAIEYGSGDGVTLNDGTVGTSASALPNRGMDYAVLTRLDLVSNNLIIEGYSKAGATIEFFIPDLDPTYFGEGRFYLASRVEGSAQDNNSTTGTYGPAAVNGLLQGQDALANRFSFTIPFSTLTAQQQASILASGLTATATLANNTSEFSGNVTLAADVYATVTPQGTVSASQTGQFVVTFGNNGPSTGNGLTTQVQLPIGLSGVSVTGGGSYNSTTGVITFPTLTSLLPGASSTATITYTQPVTAGAVTVAATILTTTGENGIYANNTAIGTNPTGPYYDLRTAISGPATTVAGQLVTYGITTSNNGPTSAASVVETVQLPTGLSYVYVSNGGTYNATSGVVTFPTYAALGSSQSFNNTVAFVAPTSNFSLTANVGPLTNDTNTGNNSSPISTTISGPAPSVAANVYTLVQSNAPQGGIADGLPVTFTVTQGNYGPQTATDIVTRLALHPGLTGVTVSNGGAYNATTGMVTWPSLTSQATLTSRTLTVTVNAPETGVLTATSSVTATTNDPVPNDNVASTQVTINTQGETDVSVLLQGPTLAIAGQAISYVATTTNFGINRAVSVITTVQLPAGLTSVTVSGSGSYNASTGLVTWPTVGTLIAGNSVRNTITFTAPQNDNVPLPLAATVRTATTESTPVNNVARLTTSLLAYADMEVSISGPDVATIGSALTYIVTRTNNGPGPSGSNVLTVQLPSNLTSVSLPNGGTYSSVTGVVTFPTVTNQVPGAAGGLVYKINLNAPDRASLTPRAYLTVTSNDDPIISNNTASVTTALIAPNGVQANLATTIVANTLLQTAGQPVAFTVTTQNNGPSEATSVTQRVALRPGLTGAVVSGTGVYDAATGIVTWTDASVPSGTTLTRTITIDTPGNGPLLASATVGGAETDPVSSNNSASVSVVLTASADVAVTVSGPSVAVTGSPATYSVTTTNSGPSLASNVLTTLQLPTGLTGLVITGSGSYNSTTGLLTWPTLASQAVGSIGVVTNTVTFPTPTTTYTVSAGTTTTTADPVLTNNSRNASTSTNVNTLPVAYDVVNTLQSPRATTSITADAISGLYGVDPDPTGGIASYRLQALLPTTQGVLYVGGILFNSTNFPNLQLTPAQANTLRFAPTNGFVGNAFFDYTAVDTRGGISNVARYTIPVSPDNAVIYTVAPGHAGNVPYLDGETIATAFDQNGGKYSAATTISDIGVRSAMLTPTSNALPTGIGFDAATGRVYVTNRMLLVPGNYTLTIMTTDEFAGVTITPVAFQIANVVLPVVLTKFTAKGQSRDAILDWATASEQNSAYFGIERSRDGGRTFTEITRKDAQGNSNLRHDYQHVDKGVGALAGDVYYRLHQVDRDGTESYSQIRVVKFTGEATNPVVATYPNPFVSELTLDLSQLDAQAFTVSLLDATGREVLTTTLTGGTQSSLDLHALTTGTYVVRITGSDGTQSTHRVVKQ